MIASLEKSQARIGFSDGDLVRWSLAEFRNETGVNMRKYNLDCRRTYFDIYAISFFHCELFFLRPSLRTPR